MKRILILISVLLVMWGCSAKKEAEKPSETPESEKTGIVETELECPILILPDSDRYDDFEQFEYIPENSEEGVAVLFLSDREVSDFTLLTLRSEIDKDGELSFVAEDVCTLEKLTPEQVFRTHLVFYGDLPNNGIRYVDSDGENHYFSITVSGKDGTLQLEELSAE